MLHELRAIIVWRVNSFFKHNFVALQLDSNALLQLPKPSVLPSSDFDAVGVNVIQAEQLVLDCKDTMLMLPLSSGFTSLLPARANPTALIGESLSAQTGQPSENTIPTAQA